MKVGDPAPRITLFDINDETPRELADWIDERPLVVIFGSFT